MRHHPRACLLAAGAADRIWDIRIYVLENPAANPLDDGWVERGQLKTAWESFALDATTFAHRGQRYLVWAQHDPDRHTRVQPFAWRPDGTPDLGRPRPDTTPSRR